MIRQKGSSISGVFVFLLLAMFAVFATMLALFGAQAYRGIVDRGSEHNTDRILDSVIANAVQADDASGAITVKNRSGVDALHIAYLFDGERYGKWIYSYQGYLRELFTSEENGFEPGDGEILCEIGEMELIMEDGLITAVITDKNGHSRTAQIALRCAD